MRSFKAAEMTHLTVSIEIFMHEPTAFDSDVYLKYISVISDYYACSC